MEDPRRNITRLHKLTDIILIGIVSVICGAETWNNVEEYAVAKEDFLRKFLELPNGIPSHDTFNRVFSALDSEQFEACFREWVMSLVELTKGEVVAVDGKTIRGAKSHGKSSPIHMVSAWASECNMVLGQVKTSEKSNEITAIPKLLEILAIADTIITIDAMGCQQEIASKIIDKKVNYILAVKNNQPQLYDDIEHEFRFGKELKTDTTINGDHGRIETRTCTISDHLDELENLDRWKNIKTIVKIESTREFKNSEKNTENAIRYYISNMEIEPCKFQRAIRSHWSIENKLHWTLDVAFGEDASRKRTGNASQNFSILNKMALNLLKNEKTLKVGVKGRRLKAGWDDEYLIKVLNL